MDYVAWPTLYMTIVYWLGDDLIRTTLVTDNECHLVWLRWCSNHILMVPCTKNINVLEYYIGMLIVAYDKDVLHAMNMT